MDAAEMSNTLGNLMYLVIDDTELASVLYKAQLAINAIGWERFRLRHEAASQVRVANKRRDRFVARHKHR
jgi:hypothetical protein